jgi:hypothetical protein
MPKPPLPPPVKPKPRASAEPATPAAEPLAEVERALSILHGRHPEAVRADRETQTAVRAKRAQSDALAEHGHRQERWARLRRLGVSVVLLAAALAAGNSYRRRLTEGTAIHAALAPVAAPYLALGFTPVSPSRFARDRVELTSENASCFVALAPGSLGLVVDRASGVLEGEGSIAWCTCSAGERATVHLRDPARGRGLLVVQADARTVGGDYALPFLAPRPHVIAPPDECSSPSLDAWLGEGRIRMKPSDASLSEDLQKGLTRCGFRPVASVPSSFPFAVVPATSEECTIAWSTVAGDALSLRLEGSGRPLVGVKTAIAFCAQHLAGTTVWREGKGELVVERLLAARVGGTHGLRETATRLGLGPLKTWVPPEELAWDATSTLRASGVSPPEIAASSEGRTVANASLLALSIEGAMVRTDAPSDSTYLCEPPLSLGSSDAVCVQGRPFAWHSVGAVGHAGIAEAAFPFWMQAFAGMVGAALPVELDLLKLGRRLVAEGFEPTTLDGVTEIGNGALVTGRAGDDAVVALQLTRETPWVLPCSEGTPWTLSGEPAIASLAPGAQLKVVCVPRAPAILAERRTVVFRHAVPQRRAN